ncbi:MAG: exodeoxyribonuclease I [Pseudomonadales bacterium]
MAKSFYWYDLETSGTDPRWDRIVQFGGFRTDMDLNPLGDELSCYVRLPDDVLPNPDATLVTGITPALTRHEGISEYEMFERVLELFSTPDTCVAGFNSLRFDDEFVRHGLYRMLRDPYEREWRNRNSRWDIIDLVRAAGALRRDGINWPTTPEGLPTYRLEEMTRANDLDHGQAHDALSDVRATVALGRLIRTHQPRLWDFYFSQRSKKEVRSLLEPFGARLCLHVSGMYPRERYSSAPVVSVCRHPTNSNSIVVADLSQDISGLLEMSADEIRDRLFAAGGENRPPLKEIRINRCPFVAGIEVLTAENWSRIGFDRKQIEERQRRLKKPGVAQKIMRVYSRRDMPSAIDPDAALYDGFLQDADRSRCQSFHEGIRRGEWPELDYEDKRLDTLARRLKARSFPERLTAEERADWEAFVVSKLAARDVPWLSLEQFHKVLGELSAAPPPDDAAASGRRRQLLEALEAHGRELARQYGIAVFR